MKIRQEQRQSNNTTQKRPKFKSSVILDKVIALLTLRKMHNADKESEYDNDFKKFERFKRSS